MRKITLKTLLAAAMMLLGTNAWAQTTLYERGTSDATAWTADNLSDFATSGSYNSFELTDNGATLKSKNSAVAAVKTISPTANAIINVEAVWLGISNTGRYLNAVSGSYFRFGNIYVFENDQDKKSMYSLNGVAYNANGLFEVAGYRNWDVSTRPFYIIKMEINTASNMLNYLRIYSSAAPATAIVNVENEVLSNADYTTIGFGYQRGGSMGTEQVEILKSIVVTETVQEVQTASYTVNYVDGNGQSLKESETREGVVGDPVAITDNDKASIYVDGVKYNFSSIENGDATIAEDNSTSVNVIFEQAPSYNYSVVSSLGTVIASGTAGEGEQVSYTYPRYELSGTDLYEAAQQTTNPYWGSSFELTTDNQVVTIAYKAAVENIVFYSEAENIEGATATSTANANIRCSMGLGGYAGANALTVTTLQPGKYVIHGAMWGNSSQNGVTVACGSNSFTWLPVGYILNCATEEFEIYYATDVTITGGDGNHPLDFIYIEKTGDVELPTTVTIPQGGSVYSSYVGQFGLDLSNTGLTAYVVSNVDLTAGQVELTEIPDGIVPAGTPVIIKGVAQGGSEVPVGNGDYAIQATNMLVGSATAATELVADRYLVISKADNLFHRATAGTLPAGKCAVDTSLAPAITEPAEGNAKHVMVGIEGFEQGLATAIRQAANAQQNAEVYTISGVRVKNAQQKGIYIIGGKKVVK